MNWFDILKYDDIPAMYEDLRREIVEYFPPRYIGDANHPKSIIGIIFLHIDYLSNPEYDEKNMQHMLRFLLNKIDKTQNQFTEDEGHDEAFVDGNTLFFMTVSGIIDKISEAVKVREQYT